MTKARRVPATDLSASGVWAMVQRNRDVYGKTWKTNFLPPLLEPFLYLLSLGFGVGALVAGKLVDGVSYAQFVAPAILAITIMQGAFFETTYNSFVRMVFQKTWEAITATPLSLDDVLVGELVWAGLKSTINATLMAIVIAGFRLLPWTSVPLVALVAFFGGMVFAGLGLMTTAVVKGIDGFSFAIYLFITPMMLFAGTFFPLDKLPRAFQGLAAVLPLTHVVAILRALCYKGLPATPGWGVLYLVAGAVVFPAIAVRMMKRKLIQ
ncbi:MAG: ABC transporter permease [Thermoplasmatota archaeon]